jgi:glycosyltransferase involved in cell wall biosynthesis
MGNNKKTKKVTNQNPTVSIVTITQIKRQETLKICLELIKDQTYKNIIEWVIVEGSKTLEDSLENEKFIKTLTLPGINIVYIPGYHLENDVPIFNNNKLGQLRNLGNNACKGDIIIPMDDDDHIFSCRVEHTVQMLVNSKCQIAGCSEKYLYDYSLERLFQFKSFGANHSTNDCMAFKKEYLLNNSHDPTCENAEEKSFTKNFTNPMVQLDPKLVLIGSSHTQNTFNKREICTFGCLLKNPANPSEGYIYSNIVHPKEKVTDLIPEKYFQRYREIFETNSYSEFDISYFCGGTSIDWDPRSNSLGGSEQAIVHLSKEWVKMGKKVCVYGKVPEITFEGITFVDWKKFPFHQKHRIVILWRMSGVNCGLIFPIKADKLWVDFHDNNFEFRINYLEYSHKIDKIFFKSEYHLEYYQNHFKTKVKEYEIIPNGLRISDFVDPGVSREPFRFCYCSCYTRGLVDILQHLWPIIYQNEPRAEFHVYYGMDSLDPNLKNQIQYLLGQPGVIDHGRQSVQMINIEKWKSTFQLYITDTNQEIDCISIRETLLTGCIPLISNSGVFKNRDGLHFDLGLGWPRIAQGILNIIRKPDFLNIVRGQLKVSKTITNWQETAEEWIN